jgi:hypothetical protein
MPTVLRQDGFRFYFYSHEPNEPPHVHVDKAGSTAKVWLQPIMLAYSIGFRARELNAILALVEANKTLMLDRWNEHFNP